MLVWAPFEEHSTEKELLVQKVRGQIEEVKKAFVTL
jgi:hypothetical protein